MPADALADWTATLTAAGAATGRAAAAFATVAAAYAEPHRHYHTLAHVAEVLSSVRRLGAGAPVELAAWLHDLVYDTRAADNEQRSADRAGELLTDLGVPADRVEAVRLLILATKHLPDAPVDADAAMLLDSDLAVLGADEPTYVVYARAIRREYHWVPERHYREGRAKVLRGFLGQQRIFRTDLFFTEREDAARRNLAWEIELLT